MESLAPFAQGFAAILGGAVLGRLTDVVSKMVEEKKISLGVDGVEKGEDSTFEISLDLFVQCTVATVGMLAFERVLPSMRTDPHVLTLFMFGMQWQLKRAPVKIDALLSKGFGTK